MNQDPRSNLTELSRNSYPGRGIVIGLDETGKYFVQVYWIMGRKENSRNRFFGYDSKTGRVFTEAADPAKMKDPSLVIYDAMLEKDGTFAVSNGDQTRSFLGRTFQGGLDDWAYEPDVPNFTPRISAACYLESNRTGSKAIAEIGITRKSAWGTSSDRHIYSFEELGEGIGLCVTTYTGDGNPLPAFHGEPYPVFLRGSIEDIANNFWISVLDMENRVALAVKLIDRQSGRSTVQIINKYEKV